jgi:hypothetical protein
VVLLLLDFLELSQAVTPVLFGLPLSVGPGLLF